MFEKKLFDCPNREDVDLTSFFNTLLVLPVDAAQYPAHK
jgi:hypothetical protein